MLSNTKFKINAVPYSDLIAGNTYLIHNNSERKKQLKKNTDYTRFKGKFVKYYTFVKQNRNIPQEIHVAVFEDVEILNDNKNKRDIPVSLYILSEQDGNISANNVSDYMNRPSMSITRSVESILWDIIYGANVGFDVSAWSFGETIINKNMKNVFGHMANDDPDPNDSYEKQRYTKLRRDVLGEKNMGNTVGEYIGTNFKFPEPSIQDLQRRRAFVERNTHKTIPTSVDRKTILEERRAARELRDATRRIVAESKPAMNTFISEKEKKKLLTAELKALKDYERTEKTRRKKENKGGRTRRNLRNE
jgi:hypothetical protein